MLEKLKSAYPILLLTAGHGAVDTYLGLLPVVAPGLAAYMGVPIGDVVMLIGICSFLNNMTQPVAGWIMGHRNLAWVLGFAVLLSSLPVWMGFMPNFLWLSVIIILGGIGTGLFHPEAALSASDVSGDKGHIGIPLFMSGGTAVYGVATPIYIWITENFGFKALGWLALPGALVSVLLYLGYRQKKRTHPSVVIRPRSRRVSAVREGVMSFWPLFAVTTSSSIATGLLISILSSHFELLFGESARTWSGWTLMVLGLCGSLMSFVWSSLGRKVGFYVLALGTQAVAFPLFLLLAGPPSAAWGFVITVPLSLVAPATLHPLAVGLSRNAAGSTQALRAALMMGVSFAMSAVAVMAAGVLLRRGMPSGWVIVVTAMCSLATIGLSVWQLWANRRRRAGV